MSRQGGVAVAVDVDKAGGQITALSLADLGGTRLGETADGGDPPVLQGHVRPIPGGAGAVQYPHISDQKIIHGTHSFFVQMFFR